MYRAPVVCCSQAATAADDFLTAAYAPPEAASTSASRATAIDGLIRNTLNLVPSIDSVNVPYGVAAIVAPGGS